jgi:hypothetical protein
VILTDKRYNVIPVDRLSHRKSAGPTGTAWILSNRFDADRLDPAICRKQLQVSRSLLDFQPGNDATAGSGRDVPGCHRAETVIPAVAFSSARRMHDSSFRGLNGLQLQFPGLRDPVYLSKGGSQPPLFHWKTRILHIPDRHAEFSSGPAERSMIVFSRSDLACESKNYPLFSRRNAYCRNEPDKIPAGRYRRINPHLQWK